jgi:hypothetical protein
MENTHPVIFILLLFTAGCVMQPQIRVPVNEDTIGPQLEGTRPMPWRGRASSRSQNLCLWKRSRRHPGIV